MTQHQKNKINKIKSLMVIASVFFFFLNLNFKFYNFFNNFLFQFCGFGKFFFSPIVIAFFVECTLKKTEQFQK
jgi:hypothetical protein